MSLPHDDRSLTLDIDEEEPGVLSRRAVMCRSVLGIAAVGLASLLAACGDDEEEPVEEVEEVEEETLEEVEEETVATP